VEVEPGRFSGSLAAGNKIFMVSFRQGPRPLAMSSTVVYQRQIPALAAIPIIRNTEKAMRGTAKATPGARWVLAETGPTRGAILFVLIYIFGIGI
jgi:hypothetical protein